MDCRKLEMDWGNEVLATQDKGMTFHKLASRLMVVGPGTKVQMGTQTCSLTPFLVIPISAQTIWARNVGYNMVWMEGNGRHGVGVAPWLYRIPLP